MPLWRVKMIADALERSANDDPEHPDAAEYSRISLHLNYRLAKAGYQPLRPPAT